MIPDSFAVKVGPSDDKSPVPVSVHISADDKLLALGAFAILGLVVYGIKASKK